MANNNFIKYLTGYLWHALAICFMLWGITALLTPFTPGSWLFFVGLFIIWGRKKTENQIVRIIGKKMFKKLGIKKILGKIPGK